MPCTRQAARSPSDDDSWAVWAESRGVPRAPVREKGEQVMAIELVSLDNLSRNWWMFTLRGLAAILFGIGTLFFPGVSLMTLVLLFGAYALVNGIFAIIAGARRGANRQVAWPFVLEGILGIGVGVVTFFWPGITVLSLVLLIGAWALTTGLIEVAMAVKLRKVLAHEWLLALSGLLSIALAALIFFSPKAGALALVLWIGAYALAFGVLLVGFSLRLRAWGKPEEPRHEPTPPLSYRGGRA